jgi:hypothetical protein
MSHFFQEGQSAWVVDNIRSRFAWFRFLKSKKYIC